MAGQTCRFAQISPPTSPVILAEPRRDAHTGTSLRSFLRKFGRRGSAGLYLISNHTKKTKTARVLARAAVPPVPPERVFTRHNTSRLRASRFGAASRIFFVFYTS
jgi:hypothetical protein